MSTPTMIRPPAPIPRYRTPPSGAPSSAARVAALSDAATGRPFLPWQRTASALLNEHDAAGRRLNPFMVVTVPRQSGKTSWALLEAVDRCIFGPPNRRVWYTAQSGAYARDKWLELVDELNGPSSPLRGRLRVKLTNGAEKAIFPNGSMLRPFPPVRDALHSQVSDLVVWDEAWKANAELGAALMQAIGPTQATRPGAQVLITSTAGTIADSTFLYPLILRARAGDPAITFLEYGIADDVDPMNLEAVAAAHPAIGHTIGRDFLTREAAVLVDMPGEFARAYGNRWTSTLEAVIDPAMWAAAATAEKLPDWPPAVLAGDIAQDRSRSAIVACSGGILEVIESAPGTDWVAPRMIEIAGRQRLAAVSVDRIGPSATLADDLERAGIKLAPLTTSSYATACERFLDDLTNRRIRYRLSPALDAAADAAAKRPLGDGWAWGRRRAAAPICELVAATLASWADQHRPNAPVRPAVSAE